MATQKHPNSASFPPRRLLPYLLATTFLLGWWSLSLFQEPTKPFPLRPQTTLSFPRETLLHALQGDIHAMHTLLTQWRDKVPTEETARYKEAITIAETLLAHAPSPQQRPAHPPLFITDDAGETIRCPIEGPYLPQTHLAASIMLALSPPEEIAALPGAMRREPQIYSNAAMSAIEQDTDRYSSEAIFSQSPRAAFVARYSNPATLETLRAQGLYLIFLDNLSSLETAISNISRIGYSIGKAAKGELLAAFTWCALHALDYEIACAQEHAPLPARTLYLNLNVHLSTPTTKNLKGLLLERLGLLWPQEAPSPSSWCIPLDQERIRAYQPESLVIAAQDQESMQHLLKVMPGLQATPACRKGNVFFVDQKVQDCPCQMIALSYYDLCCAILSGQEAA